MQMFRQIQRAEELGFDSIWLTEHHLTDDGYLPSLMPMAAAIAARTTRVQIGTYVLLFPFYHPIKLAEDIAVVDVISGGRLRIGVGQAYRAEEFAAFGSTRSSGWDGPWRPSRSSSGRGPANVSASRASTST